MSHVTSYIVAPADTDAPGQDKWTSCKRTLLLLLLLVVANVKTTRLDRKKRVSWREREGRIIKQIVRNKLEPRAREVRERGHQVEARLTKESPGLSITRNGITIKQTQSADM